MTPTHSPLVSMAAVNAQYLTKCSIFTAVTGGFQIVLKADTRRYWLNFQQTALINFTNPLLPGPNTWGTPPSGSTVLPQTFNWRDCPAIVGGEWWAGIGAGNQILIIEQLYVGDQ